MQVVKQATAGTLESSDVMITVKPYEKGIQIEIKSDVASQFGEEIKKVIKNTVKNMEVNNIYVKANDKGALDYAIRARTETAILRACQ
ncbi:MAG: citrate lyase acyl carrier protein [Halanaerobiaceae bacterium]